MSAPAKGFKTVESLVVTAQGTRVGELTRVEGQGIYFTYDRAWIADGFNLSPITMKFDDKPQRAQPEPFKGLHGPFADSLPDGWGLKLMDRFFDATFGAGTSRILTPLDRLAYMGDRAMGFLEYHPKTEQATAETVDLAQLFKASVEVQRGDTQDVLRGLRIAGGSPGGARPKAVVALSDHLDSASSAFGVLPPGFEHWLVKFRALDEPRETGPIEQAYARMAREAGVTMAHTALLDVKLSDVERERVFAAKRFDRDGNRKIHMMTVSALADADYRLPSLDYSDLLKLTSHLTKSAVEVEKMARLMIFNAVFHNYDDHTKNFAFLYSANQESEGQTGWSLAPAYDLTFSNGMGEHATAYGGMGKPDRKALKNLCKDYKYLKADQYIDQTLAAFDNWRAVIQDLELEQSADLGAFNVLEHMRDRFVRR